MKKILLCLLAASVVTACTKDDTTAPAGNPEDLVLTFGAGTDEFVPDEADPEVRAGYDGLKSIWHAGDKVSLSLDAVNKNLQFSQIEGSLSPDATKVQFTGTLNSPVTGNVTGVSYYPYSATAAVSGTTITTDFPATQNYVSSGYRGIPLFSSYTGDIKAMKLGYKNLFSVVKLTLNKGISLPATVNLRKIYFAGNNNETVSGAMVVNMSGATPAVSYTGTGKTVMLDLGAGVPLTAVNQSFYIAVPAINYTKGYSFTFITDQGQVTKSAKNTGANYAVNKIYAAPALTINSLSLISIPDSNLRDALQQLGLISILDPLNGLVSITTAGLQAASIDISGKGIADLTGLSNFPALVTLKAGNNNIVTADLSKLTLLTNLDLSHNQLTGLNLAANTALLSLDLSANSLTSLNLSANTLLTSLNLSTNQLTSLNLAANVALLSLDVSSNLLSSLDLHNNILLTTLKVYGNPLVTLNISGLKALLSLQLVNGVESINTVLKTLTVPAAATVQNIISDGVLLTNWLRFVVQNNPNLLSLSVKNSVGLLSVTATGNANLASLDVSGNVVMTDVTCNSNALTSLNVSGNIALLTLNAASNKLASLNLSTVTAITSLDVSTNLLTNLDLHNNTALLSAKVYGNALSTLNISGLLLLNALYLDAVNTTTNAINALTLTIPVNATVKTLVAEAMTTSLWTSFVCLNNATIQSISLKGNVKLLSANVTGNSKLESLNVSGNILQTTLRTSGSTLETLNISGTVALLQLYLDAGNNNSINLLKLTIPAAAKVQNLIANAASAALNWTSFECTGNSTIQTISLQNNTLVTAVTAKNNSKLTSLNVKGCTLLTVLGIQTSNNAAGFTVTGPL